MIAALGVLNDSPSPLPDWYLNTFIVAATGAVATLVLVLLWQFSSRLTGALDEAVGAINALSDAQIELEAEHERLDTTPRSIGDGVIATNANGRVAFLNPVAERLTGWSQADAMGQPFAMVFDARSEATGAPVTDIAWARRRDPGRVGTGHGVNLQGPAAGQRAGTVCVHADA